MLGRGPTPRGTPSCQLLVGNLEVKHTGVRVEVDDVAVTDQCERATNCALRRDVLIVSGFSTRQGDDVQHDDHHDRGDAQHHLARGA